jgi:hypothetical protein
VVRRRLSPLLGDWDTRLFGGKAGSRWGAYDEEIVERQWGEWAQVGGTVGGGVRCVLSCEKRIGISTDVQAVKDRLWVWQEVEVVKRVSVEKTIGSRA